MERWHRINLNAKCLWEDLIIGHVGHYPCNSNKEYSTRVDLMVQLHGYKDYFETKIIGIEIMRGHALDKLKALELIHENNYIYHEVMETATFFEAYINAVFSVLEIVAKFTPFFYRHSVSEKPITNYGFLEQYKKLKEERRDLDPEYSAYLEKTALPWYEVLRENRAALTHRAAVYITFGEDGRVRFLRLPRREEWLEGVFDWSAEPLEKYVNQSYDNLLDFLEFYLDHFHNKIPDVYTRQWRRDIENGQDPWAWMSS